MTQFDPFATVNAPSYAEVVQSFDHSYLAKLPSYGKLRRVMSDLGNEIAELPNEQIPTLSEWLQAFREMAATTQLADACDYCKDVPGARAGEREYVAWPCAGVVDKPGGVKGVYVCALCGHAWTCWYSVNPRGVEERVKKG